MQSNPNIHGLVEVESAPVPFRAMEARVAKAFGVNKRNVRIDWNHPVGEDVIYIHGEFKGYLDYEHPPRQN